MKRLSATIFSLGLLASTSAAAEIDFRGGFCLTAVTPACTAVGWPVGCHVNFRYSPRNFADNGPSTKLSLFDGFYAAHYKLETGSLIGNIFRPVAGVNIWSGVSSFNAQMRITNQTPTPANLTLNSTSVSIIGSIRDFDSITDCDVTFKAAGVNSNL